MADPYLRGSGETIGSLETQAGKHSNWYDAYNDFFGKGIDDQDWANRELDDNGRVKVTKGDILMGRSQPELQLEYEKWRKKKIEGGKDAEAYRQTFGVAPEVKAGMGTTDIAKLTLDEQGRIKAVDQLMPTLAGMDNGAEVIASLGDRPSKESVLAAISTLKTSNKGKEEAKIQQERLRQEEVQAGIRDENRETEKDRYAHLSSESNRRRTHEALETAKLRAFETQQANSQRAHTAEQNNLTRQYQTEVAKYNAETKLKLGSMESADRRADRRASREDRLALQRQNSIAQLIKGLTQLGAGMAI